MIYDDRINRAVSRLLIPINNPPATMAGIIGTNISDNILTKRCKGFICFDDLSFTSAVVDGSFPVIFLTLQILY